MIDCPDAVKADEIFTVTAAIGKEIAHPNTTEHHIRWIKLFYHAQGEKFPNQIGSFEFSAHGEHAQGPNQGFVYTHHAVTASLKVKKPGTLYATSYCNIHGLWDNSKEISLK